MIQRYVWRGGRFVDKTTGEPMQVRDMNAICMPMIQSDIGAYRSPIDGRMIDGRREQREDLKRNGCVLKEDPPKKFDREEYAERKRRQAKHQEARRAGL